VNISKTKNDFPKEKTPFCFTLKSLSNKQQLFFYFTGTLIGASDIELLGQASIARLPQDVTKI